MQQVVAHRTDDAHRHLRTTGSVEVRHPVPAVHPLERRELRTNLVDPRRFGRGQMRSFEPTETVAWRLSDDAKLFATTFAAGFLFAGGDQSLIGTALTDAQFAGFVRGALAGAPLVITDRAMTAAMGARYSTNPEPTEDTVQPAASEAFLADGTSFADGLGIVDGVTFEPRITLDQRWGPGGRVDGRSVAAGRRHQRADRAGAGR